MSHELEECDIYDNYQVFNDWTGRFDDWIGGPFCSALSRFINCIHALKM